MNKSWTVGGILAALVTLGGGLLTSCSPQESQVTLFQWEDYNADPFLAGYEARYGKKPATMIFADEDEAFAKMRAGFKPDVMGPCYYEFPRWREAGLLKPIDTSKLKNWNKLSPTLRELPGLSPGPATV